MGKKAWILFQSQTKKWIDSHIAETTNFDFLRLWEQASITNLTQTLKENLDQLVKTETQREPTSSDFEVLRCYKTALKWIKVCEEVIEGPLQNCHVFFRNILPQFIALKFDLRSVVDSISIYRTIALALISYVTVTPSPESIIVPHMYARALSVYDSLLPKEKRQNVLKSCCNPDYIKRETQLKSIRCGLVQCLHIALKQIELLLVNESLNTHSDLFRITSILVLTLYMNYAMLVPTSDSSEIS